MLATKRIETSSDMLTLSLTIKKRRKTERGRQRRNTILKQAGQLGQTVGQKSEQGAIPIFQGIHNEMKAEKQARGERYNLAEQREKIREKGNSESLEPMIVLATRANEERHDSWSETDSPGNSHFFHNFSHHACPVSVLSPLHFFSFLLLALLLPSLYSLLSVPLCSYCCVLFPSFLILSFTSVSSEISSTHLLIGLILASVTACSLLFPTSQSLACLFVIVVLFSFEFDARLASITKSLRDSDEAL